MTNPSRLTLEQPLDIDDARRAARKLADQRRQAEDYLGQVTEEAAEAERVYRKELAKAWVTVEEGTAAEREAKARAEVADKSFDRDLKASMVKVQTERLRGLEGERSILKSLIDWSARMELSLREAA